MTPPSGRIPGRGGAIEPRIEVGRTLGETPTTVVADPFTSLSPGGVSDLARLGEMNETGLAQIPTLPIDNAPLVPGVLQTPDVSNLVPVSDLVPNAPSGFWSRLIDGIARFFGWARPSDTGVSVFDAAVDPMAARRAIALDTGAGEAPLFSLSDPNPFVRVRNKLEIDMPGNDRLDAFLERLAMRAPDPNRTEARAILSLLSDPAAGSSPNATSLRAEVAAEVNGAGRGYVSRYQIAEAVRTVLARHGLIFRAPGPSPTAEEASAEAVFHNLSLQLLPDDVPVYRTIARNVVDRSGGAASMAANLDGMTYWGVGSEGVAVTRTYVDEGHVLVTTTVGELRRLGMLTTDDIAIAGNAVELYHQPLESGGWRPVPVSVMRRSSP